MIIGILSDTHDRVDNLVAGLRALETYAPEFYIHCGDIGGQRSIDQLAGLKCAFVFGNNDFDRVALARYAADIGVGCYGNFADIELGGKRFAILHGDDFALRQRILSAQEHDYLLQGHTHVPEDRRIGRTHVINPGALHRANLKTVSVLDTQTDVAKLLPVAI